MDLHSRRYFDAVSISDKSVADYPLVWYRSWAWKQNYEVGIEDWKIGREAFRVDIEARMVKREALAQRAMRRRLARARAGSAVVDMRTMDLATVDADGYVVVSC